MPAACNQHSNF
jgi:hypothetical protein